DLPRTNNTQCNASIGYGTSSGYDGLNRLTTKQYTGGTVGAPGVTYTYCNSGTSSCSHISFARGRLISSSVAGGTTVKYFGFDADGRITLHSQSDPNLNGGAASQFTYTYNLTGF